MTSDADIGTLSAMSTAAQRDRRYRVVFRGESSLLAHAFPNLKSEFDGGNTALVGSILDQPQLLGILERANSLGFELISLNPIASDRPHDG